MMIIRILDINKRRFIVMRATSLMLIILDHSGIFKHR